MAAPQLSRKLPHPDCAVREGIKERDRQHVAYLRLRDLKSLGRDARSVATRKPLPIGPSRAQPREVPPPVRGHLRIAKQADGALVSVAMDNLKASNLPKALWGAMGRSLRNVLKEQRTSLAYRWALSENILTRRDIRDACEVETQLKKHLCHAFESEFNEDLAAADFPFTSMSRGILTWMRQLKFWHSRLHRVQSHGPSAVLVHHQILKITRLFPTIDELNVITKVWVAELLDGEHAATMIDLVLHEDLRSELLPDWVNFIDQIRQRCGKHIRARLLELLE